MTSSYGRYYSTILLVKRNLLFHLNALLVICFNICIISQVCTSSSLLSYLMCVQYHHCPCLLFPVLPEHFVITTIIITPTIITMILLVRQYELTILCWPPSNIITIIHTTIIFTIFSV